ncbi:MAG: hypothetical protein ABMA64_41335, partial [Myxococcota bacterium]
MLLIASAAAMFGFVGLVAVIVVSTRAYEGPRRFEPVSVLPPVRETPPAAPAAPREQPPVSVPLSSEPLHAKVYENEQFVCETPCTIQHPAHAPLPRSFVFKADGYRDVVFDMVDANQPVQVRLTRARAPTGPPPAV